MKKIAVLYICTGNYYIFWKNFYDSAQQYFLPQHQKHYFVFTDSQLLKDFYGLDKNITFIDQKKLGWPHDTLMRYEMFMQIKKELATYDYIYFLNANIIFKQEVGEEFLPNEKEENGIVAVLHPGYCANKNINEYVYDRQEKSLAYIPYNNGKHYVCGGINGGKSTAYLTLIEKLYNNINIDLKNDIIALWHDESHFNKYIYELAYKVKLLSPAYAFPQGENIPGIECKMLLLHKKHFGGHDFMRSHDDISTYLRKLVEENEALRNKIDILSNHTHYSEVISQTPQKSITQLLKEKLVHEKWAKYPKFVRYGVYGLKLVKMGLKKMV